MKESIKYLQQERELNHKEIDLLQNDLVEAFEDLFKNKNQLFTNYVHPILIRPLLQASNTFLFVLI